MLRQAHAARVGHFGDPKEMKKSELGKTKPAKPRRSYGLIILGTMLLLMIGIAVVAERMFGGQYRWMSNFGKAAGRNPLVVSAGLLVFEGSYATGYFSACASQCGYRAGENYRNCLNK